MSQNKMELAQTAACIREAFNDVKSSYYDANYTDEYRALPLKKQAELQEIFEALRQRAGCRGKACLSQTLSATNDHDLAADVIREADAYVGLFIGVPYAEVETEDLLTYNVRQKATKAGIALDPQNARAFNAVQAENLAKACLRLNL
jgi:hypothetical protein